MPSMKIYKIKAYFKSYDAIAKKMTCMFLDDGVDNFTRSFLTRFNEGMPRGSYGPIKDNEFTIKVCSYSTAHRTQNQLSPIHISDLVGQFIEMHVNICSYSYMIGNRRQSRWEIKLISAMPL